MPKSVRFCKKNCDNKIPKGNKLDTKDEKLLNDLKGNVKYLIKAMDKQNLNEYIKTVVGHSFDANKYFNDSEPWSVKKKDQNRMENILFTVCEQIKNISILLHPIIPISTEKVLNSMNIQSNKITIDQINNLDCFDHNRELKNLEILFNKVENDN